MDREVLTTVNGTDVYYDEIGVTYSLKGALIGNGEIDLVLSLPDEYPASFTTDLGLSAAEWTKLMKFSDDPLIAIADPNNAGLVKAIIRKSQRQIEENLRWQVYKRDSYTCQYCGHDDRPLTVDHKLAQQLGGETTLENLVSACRPCNKAKGNMTWERWEAYMKQRGMKGPLAIQ